MSHSTENTNSHVVKFGSWSNFLYTSRKPPFLGTVSTEEELLQKFKEKFKDDLGAFWYVAGSAGSESTFRANRAIFDKWKLIPRMLIEATNRNLEVELFGVQYPSPVILAPIGVQGILHQEAELASARAAAKVGVVFTMSTASTRSIELVAKANGNGHRWYQLYWPRTEAITLSILKRAKEQDSVYIDVLVLTVDTMLLGYRWHDLETSYLPFLHGVGTQVGTSDPAFMAKHNEQPTEDYYPWPYNASVYDKAYLEGDAKIKRQVEISTDWIGEINSGIFRDWKELEFLKRNWDGPLILKGIQSKEDAERALRVGVDGIIVSNHGGRQVDGAVASLRALEYIMKSELIKTAQLEGKFTVLFDSGIRTGSDIIKAIALGANAVLLGRPYVYGLALGGESGVENVVRNILCELDITLGLIGGKSIKDIHGKANELLYWEP
ncbi:hypothetical protein Clacol_007501 [Clathrus columnatus]|uniref:FMN hydroxy acid dehydrogenase domain-containing protein n=1 Tax=Clathrus columnatus TaxID=1419009 RepID=A0AAV5AK51_9AGAM|nr:hypothetical protein Clacol_007501 [Clathrus columnatus]